MPTWTTNSSVNFTMIQELMDLDSQKIRYVSESSNTSGYSSPAQSPSMSLQAEFSNLNLPAASPQHHQQPSSGGYAAMQTNATLRYSHPTVNFMNYNAGVGVVGTAGVASAAMVTLPQQSQLHHFGVAPPQQRLLTGRVNSGAEVHVKTEYAAMLRILEQPVEKFRFRYKSEMHGTHGSLNGANSKRTPKTFPEVELCNFNGHAVIRCSLFQTNLESPHSHQLVVRKDDTDICDPHDLHVSPDRGYVAQFQNMGIIHTAKKFIVEELLKKKMNRLRFELGRDELSTKEKQELHKETEKEAKDMNLNQVRLCFEAFKVEDDNTWTRIAAPVYTTPINNRKSAQTGELRICRLSIATGSVSGGDDLILLVEKVSKKNIKVRFYELDEDEGLVWEAFGKFRESDVHHQYAIVCQTPTYKNKDIDKPVEVYIELVRPTDDERSYPPVTFRYKPRDVIVSRKRRRTCSTATSSSGSGSSLSSFELPKPVQEQTANIKMGAPQLPQFGLDVGAPTISEEFNKEDELKKLLGSENFRECMQINSEELAKLCNMDSIADVMDELQQTGSSASGYLETDGTSSDTVSKHQLMATEHRRQQLLNAILLAPMNTQSNSYLQRIFKIYDNIRIAKQPTEAMLENAAKEVADIFSEHAEKNELGDTILHEIVASDNAKLAFKTFHILGYLKLNHLFNSALNAHGESALHCACLHNRPQYIRPLLGLGCDSSIQNRRSDTALHIAVREQHQKCVESFLNMERLRLDLSIKNDEGFTALHLAIRCNDYDVAKMLLQHDRTAAFVPNTKDGNNALHMAVLQQHLKMVKLIVSAQNERQFRRTPNAAGRTALELAKELNTKVGNEIVAYLASLGSDDGDARLVIKEEEMSCSSTEDDDENEASSLTDDTTQALELVKVKEEFLQIDTDETHDETTPKTIVKTACNLEQILKDERKFERLAQMLNASGKWTILAEACKMQHLLCLWSNAADLLNYVRQKANNIDYNTFAAALAKIDERALQILQTT